MTAHDPAFPNLDREYRGRDIYSSKGGLTKREYFAACAMQGLCANSILKEGVQEGEIEEIKVPEYIANAAISIADALLAELQKERT